MFVLSIYLRRHSDRLGTDWGRGRVKGEDGFELHAPGSKQTGCVQILQRRGTTVSYKIPDTEKAI